MPGEAPNPEDVVDAAAGMASGVIDMHLAKGGYPTPVDLAAISNADVQARVTNLLRHICVAIGLYHLSPGISEPTKGLEKAYREAMKWLELLAEGKVRLGIAKTGRVFGVSDETLENEIPADLHTAAWASLGRA